MYILADSSTTRTEWVLVDGEQIVAQAYTQGLNPYFLSRREISHCVRLELPDEFFRKRWDHIYFYGAGCANPEKNKILESSLVAQFRTPVTINSDLLGAARGLFVRNRGLGCILGTGSNSCVYDGEKILKNIKSGGYILGDEGSGSDIGKTFINDCLKNLAPKEIIEGFYETYAVTADEIMDEVYSGPAPNKTLAKYAFYLAPLKDHPYVEEIVKNAFSRFFSRCISQYNDYEELPVGFVGKVALNFESHLRAVATEYGVEISRISDRSIPGLIQYHSK